MDLVLYKCNGRLPASSVAIGNRDTAWATVRDSVIASAYVESRGIVAMTIRFVQACGGGVMPIGRQIVGPANKVCRL